MEKMNKSEQEVFWAGEFGSKYINRNNSEELLASNILFFSRIFSSSLVYPERCLELGANIGMNIRALKQLLPKSSFTGVEINSDACEILEQSGCEVLNTSILELEIDAPFDLVFTKGVLIHQDPNDLPRIYQKMYSLASRWILIAEYYNPTPVALEYRGHANKLFKRDFAGEFLDIFSDVELKNYGFVYKGDDYGLNDDISWFLLEKQN